MPDQTVVFDDERPDDERPPTDVEVRQASGATVRSAKAALALRLQGASNAEIAEVLGYDTPGTAKAAWEGILAKSYDDETDPVAFRKLQSARMNRQLKSVSSIAFKETIQIPDPDGGRDADGNLRMVTVPNPRQMDALKEFRNGVESLSRLHGVEAPKVMALVTPEAKELEMVVSKVVAAAKSGGAVEGDIFGEDIIDAEVVDE
jgi:hypothetical protein